MATTKRAYKLQEFVAHSSNVNCLKIGRKSSRVLVTGGEDHKVNLWTIGKPDAILSLSGHTSAIESVNFDSSERLVAAGAASGTIKLWDLEEAKIVRTLTGHRSNCVSVDFHPFGEFFASGSLDTNLKIWDIRRKGCIHTYKGHTRGVNAIRFTPDGRWVVSGGEDNTVKLWDLTAGKLLHDFKCHDGQIQCIDFHPHEFLLATGSADKTVKFWDLETFELIGSAGPETAGVRSMTFNSDGRTLLCGLHESLKVFSWEPVRCHDTLDVGWSKLSDMNIHEGKLLGCSYNQSCVGVWVVDISRVEPYTAASNGRPSSCSETKPTSANMPNGIGRLSVSQDATKETKSRQSSGSAPSTPQRTSLNTGPKISVAAAAPPGNATLKRTSSKSHGNLTNAVNTSTINKSDVGLVAIPRNNLKVEQSSEYRREIDNGKPVPYNMQLKLTDCQEMSNTSDLDRRMNITAQSGFTGGRKKEANNATNPDVMSQPIMIEEKKFDGVRCFVPPRMGVGPLAEPSTSYHQENYDSRTRKSRPTADAQGGGRMRSLVANWERREVPSSENTTSNNTIDVMPSAKAAFMRRHVTSTEKETVSASDEDAIADLLEHHKQFMNSAQSRLTKLQVVHRLWDRKDFRGVISAMEKMSDYAVSADVVSVISEKSNIITLDLCTIFLPLLTSLLESNMDRHLTVSIEMMLKLIQVFGNVIHSTISGPPLVGVDLQAEQRLERCNICYIELEKIKQIIPSLTRRGGSITKLMQELKLALQEII